MLRSSNDILDDSFSIRINSNNVDEIREAILNLKENSELLHNMHNNALKHAVKFSLSKRATNVISFMQGVE